MRWHLVLSLGFSLALACGDDSSPVDASAADSAVDGDLRDADVQDAATDSLEDAMSDVARDVALDVALDTSPPEPLRSEYTFPVRFPEGGAFDPIDRDFYVGSLADGSVRRVNGDTGEETLLFTESADGVWWTLGMDVDPEARRLFVCAMDDQRETTEESPPYLGYVWVFDLETGERTASHSLSEAFPRATCTDLVVVDGQAYVCDREHPNIYRVNEEDGAELFVSDDLLMGGLAGQNAIEAVDGGLLVAVYTPPRIVRVGLDERVTRVRLGGTFSVANPLHGADGLALLGGDAYVVFPEQLTRLRPDDASWEFALADTIPNSGGWTAAITAEERLYILNGQAISFALGRLPEPSVLREIDPALFPE